MTKFKIGILLAVVLSGCQLVPTPMPAPTMPPIPTASSEIDATPAVEQRTLTVCLGTEPQSLYIYGTSSEVTWSVLEAVYDGPIDFKTYTPTPVIMEELPTISNGGVVIEPAVVQSGDIVVDKDGDLVALSDGIEVFPSGCGQPECAVSWDDANPVRMDKLRATYKLLPNIKWADGAPLTADDSIYSYELASDPETPVSKRVIERTTSYKALDATSVEWIGIPGYFPLPSETMFWHPLPRHAWSQYSAQDLLNDEISMRHPLGWGPYMIDEWVEGDHITLNKNPNYFRASEGLPKFDKLVYRFLAHPGESNLEALLSGECDVVDRTTGLEEQAQNVRQAEIDNKLKMYYVQGPDSKKG
jgi:peptide/nickel transport system substrate-binding protein